MEKVARTTCAGEVDDDAGGGVDVPLLVLTVCFWLLLQVDAEDAHAVWMFLGMVVCMTQWMMLLLMAMRLMVTSESVVSKRHETRRQTDQQPQEQQHSEHEQPQHEAAAASRSTRSVEALTAASAPPSA